MTQLTREERFRVAAEAEGGMPVSAGPRVGHLRTAEGEGPFLYVDLLSVRESERPALVARIKELVAVAASAVDEREAFLAAIVGHATRTLESFKAIRERLAVNLGPHSPDLPAGGDDRALAHSYAMRADVTKMLYEAARDRFLEENGGLQSAEIPALDSKVRDAALKWLEGKGGVQSPEIPALDSKMREAALKWLEGKGGPESPATRTFNELIRSYATAGRIAGATNLVGAGLAPYDVAIKFEATTLLETILLLYALGGTAEALERAGAAAPELTGRFDATLMRTESKLGPDHPKSTAHHDDVTILYITEGCLFTTTELREAILKRKEGKAGAGRPASSAECRSD